MPGAPGVVLGQRRVVDPVQRGEPDDPGTGSLGAADPDPRGVPPAEHGGHRAVPDALRDGQRQQHGAPPFMRPARRPASVGRQPDGHPQSSVGHRRGVDRPVVRGDDRPHDGQAQPGAPLPGPRPAALPERFEQLADRRARRSPARTRRPRAPRRAPVTAGAHGDPAAGHVVPHRVLHQIADQPAQQRRVARTPAPARRAPTPTGPARRSPASFDLQRRRRRGRPGPPPAAPTPRGPGCGPAPAAR